MVEKTLRSFPCCVQRIVFGCREDGLGLGELERGEGEPVRDPVRAGLPGSVVEPEPEH